MRVKITGHSGRGVTDAAAGVGCAGDVFTPIMIDCGDFAADFD